MSAIRDRVRTSEIDAPAPPRPLSVYELVTLRRMIESQQKLALKKIRKARAKAIPGQRLEGADADAVRAWNLKALDEKMEAWLNAAWPAVRAAIAEAEGAAEKAGAEEDEAREAWLAESRLEGARLAAQDDD